MTTIDDFDHDKFKQQLSMLMDELDDESLQELDSASVNETYKKLYQFGQIIEGADNFLTFSFTNLTGKYQAKLWLTTIIAYLFRAIDEWEVPDDVQVFPVYDYCKGLRDGIDIIDEHYKKLKDLSPKLKRDIQFNKEFMKKRIIARTFLEEICQFDPDKHVRSAYRPQPRDKERTVLETPAAKLAIACLKFKDAEFREEMINHERNLNLMNMSTSTAACVAAADQNNAAAANGQCNMAAGNGQCGAAAAADQCNKPEPAPYNVGFFNDLVDPNIDIKQKIINKMKDSDNELYHVVRKLLEKYQDIDRINVEYMNSCTNIVTDAFEKINERFCLDAGVLDEIKQELQTSYDGRLGILKNNNQKAISVLKDIAGNLYRDYGLNDGKILVNTYNMIPPDDTFHRIRMYMETNYDSLIEAVKNLYCESPDLDMAIIPHNWHKSEEEAADYIKRHKNQAIAEMIKAQSGLWNFFAPYEKVRDTTVFLNDKTIVLEEIIAQQKRDAKITADLLEKKMHRQKRKNIREEGPEAEGFKEWRKQNSTLRNMGAIEIDPYEDDCPPDAVEIDVFRVNPKEGTIKKNKIYSKAEAPTFMEEHKEAIRKKNLSSTVAANSPNDSTS